MDFNIPVEIFLYGANNIVRAAMKLIWDAKNISYAGGEYLVRKYRQIIWSKYTTKKQNEKV